MKITFCTCNAYTIIYSYLLKKKYYRDEETTLIISDLVLADYLAISKKIDKLGIFDKVIIMQEKGVSAEAIENKCEEIIDKNSERFHVYTFGSLYNRWVLANGLGEKIMTDEGVATYIDLTLYDYIDIKKIDKAWIGNVKLYCGILLKDKLVEINMTDFIEENIEEICEELNYIFNINDEDIEVFPKKIFLDQYLKPGILKNEDIILGRILNPIFINESIEVKMHPTQAKYVEKFSERVKLCDYSIPFELFILNRLKKQKISKEELEEISIYTITSSAAISFKLLINKTLNINNFYFLDLYSDGSELNNSQIKLVKKLEKVYSNNVRTINCIKEFQPFYNKNKYEINLIKLYKLYLRKTNKEYLEKIITCDKLFSLPKNSKIAIWGAGNLGIELVNELSEYTNFNISCIIDNFQEGDINGIPIISQYDAELSEIEFIINTTVCCRYVVESYLNRLNYRNYISIY